MIRDHDREKFEARKAYMTDVIEKLNEKYDGRITLDLKDQYYNMKEKVEPVMFIVDIAKKSMEEVGITPNIIPIRGGTDGSRLSYEGLPCPNIFTGGMKKKKKNECVSIDSMERCSKLIIKIAENYTER